MYQRLIYFCYDHGYVIAVALFLVVGVDPGPFLEIPSSDRARCKKEGKLSTFLGIHDQLFVGNGFDSPVDVEHPFLNRLALPPETPRLEQEGNA